MSGQGFSVELPLLRRELTELAARRRTFVIRFLGAIILMLWVFYVLETAIRSMAMVPGVSFTTAIIGIGGQVFERVVPALFYSVILMMPGLICGSITLEKERNTLGTLFVTRLSPTTIILEKLGSRLIPMLTFLLLTSPPLAFLYSLGGVDFELLMLTCVLLLAECILFASVGLLCSAWFSTTISAFMAAYILSALIVSLPLVGLHPWTPHSIWYQLATPMMQWTSEQTLLGFVIRLARGMGYSDVKLAVALAMPSLMFSGFCLLLTRLLLFRRAFVSQTSWLLKAFQRVDAFFTSINSVTGGVVLVQDRESLPEDEPVAWRERTRKSLGKARYLIRVLLAIEGPVFLFCIIAIIWAESVDREPLSLLLWMMWVLATMILIVKSATLISSERMRETLEPLLSTPLTSREILVQKVKGMQRLMLVLAAPIMTIHISNAIMSANFGNLLSVAGLTQFVLLAFYLVLAGLTTAVGMQMVAWISIRFGLRAKTQAKSIILPFFLIGTWAFISRVLLAYTYNWGYSRDLDLFRGHVALMPFRIDGSIVMNERFFRAGHFVFRGYRGYDSPSQDAMSIAIWAVFVLGFHAALMFLFRWRTLKVAPRLLNRCDSSQQSQLPATSRQTI